MSEEKQTKDKELRSEPESLESKPESSSTEPSPQTIESNIENESQTKKPEIIESPLASGPKESVTITKSSYNKMIAGIVVVVAIAAFFGGYSLGTLDSANTVTTEQLAGILEELKVEGSAQTQQASSAPTPVFVSIDDDPIKGNPDAPVTIVEFSDFQCPFCLRFYDQTLPLIEENYIKTGKVKMVYRDMPLQIHPNAFPVHIAAECANDQGAFWEYHDLLFERQSEWNKLAPADLGAKILAYAEELELDSSFATCMQSQSMVDEIRKDYSQGAAYGVTGTPSFFVGNDQDGFVKLSGAQPFSIFKEVIDSQLG